MVVVGFLVFYEGLSHYKVVQKWGYMHSLKNNGLSQKLIESH